LEYIRKENINPTVYLHVSEKNLNKISLGKEKPDFFFVHRLHKSFSGIDWKALKAGTAHLSQEDKPVFQKKTAKLRYLNEYLTKNHSLTLQRALSLSSHEWKNLDNGFSFPSRHLLKKTAVYFCLPPEFLLDDTRELPKFEDIKVDENLVVIQRNDIAETVNKIKNSITFPVISRSSPIT
jgi:hypothetical protein